MQRLLSFDRADQIDPGRDHEQSAGSIQHAGDHEQSPAGRQDSIRHRRFPGVRADERTHVRDTKIAQGTRPRTQGRLGYIRCTGEIMRQWWSSAINDVERSMTSATCDSCTRLTTALCVKKKQKGRKLAPYGTGGRPLLTANIKVTWVTWHKKN